MQSLDQLEQSLHLLLDDYHRLGSELKQLQEKEAQQREELMRAHSELYTLQQQHRALLTAHQMSGGNEADRLKAKEQLTRIIAQVTRAMEALKQ